MSDFGKIKWEVREEHSPYQEQPHAQGSDSFEFFLNYCKAQLPNQDLVHDYHFFLKELSRLNQEMRKSLEFLSQQPFLSAFLIWIKEIALDPTTRLWARMLLENGFIGIKDQKDHVWTISNAQSFDHRNVVEAIRCHREWTFELRESLVKTYLEYMHWLSSCTFGYIPKLEDPDLLRSRGRSLAYSNFIHFLSKLNDKDQLVAKLLYFGGSRTLEEVLELNIENVDFSKCIVNFGLQPVVYPLHIFSEIKEISEGRKKGRIFIGRRGHATMLNPSTIFRNFKEAALEIGLGKNFTPKTLITNV